MGLALPYQTIQNLNLEEAITEINSKRTRLSDVKLYELLFSDDAHDHTNRHGIYVFYNEEGKAVYVGKNSSQHFIHRISTHLSLSMNFIGNTFLRYYLKKVMGFTWDKNDHLGCFAKAAKHASGYSLAIVPTNDNGRELLSDKQILRLEKLLRVYLKPQFNTYHFKKELNRCLKNLEEIGHRCTIDELVRFTTKW